MPRIVTNHVSIRKNYCGIETADLRHQATCYKTIVDTATAPHSTAVTIMAAPIWLSVPIATVASASALILAFQRVNHHKTRLSERNDREKSADIRDPTKPFSTTNRDAVKVTATILHVALLSFALGWKFYDHPSHADHDDTFRTAITLISWLYALTLSIVSLKHKIPEAWGWILNVHLFIIFITTFIMDLFELRWLLKSYANATTSTISIFTLVSSFFLTGLLCGVTGTTRRGAPFLDRTGRPVDPIVVSSIFEFLSFEWITPLLIRGSKTDPLKDSELWILPTMYRGWNLYNTFKRHRDRGLIYRLIKANQTAFILQIILTLITSSLYYAAPFCMNRILVFMEDYADQVKYNDDQTADSKRPSLEIGYIYVLGLFLSKVALALFNAQLWYWAASSLQIRVKSLCNIEVYVKTLKRRSTSTATDSDGKDVAKVDNEDKKDSDDSNDDDPSSSTGKIVNLMSTDSSRIADYAKWWIALLGAPIELSVGILFLYQLLGLSCFVGLLVMIVTLPINHYTAKSFAKTQERLMEARDKRVSLMNEVLQGVRQIKFFAWEKQWTKRILATPNVSLRNQLSFDLAQLEGKDLTPAIAFTSITVFNELRFALNILPEAVMDGLQALISVRRIEKYLQEPEIEYTTSSDVSTLHSESKIGFDDATIAWDYPSSAAETANTNDAPSTQKSFILKDVNLSFPIGELSVVCGATGAGKTLLLLGLLGETRIIKGQAFCPRTPVFEGDLYDDGGNESTSKIYIAPENWIQQDAMAFVAQTAWLQNASIRDNILFGLPYNEQRYLDVLDACALTKDLDIFEDGDETEIGEKGITLSGGQKQRVALARAVYSRAGVVVMDDVLSAVDAHTARHIYEKCLMGPLLAGQRRTQILVTHHVRLCISDAAYVVSIKNGKIGLSGTPGELRQSGVLSTILQEEEVLAETERVDTTAASSSSSTSEAGTAAIEEQPKFILKRTNKPKKLVDDEARETGMVKARIYGIYSNIVGGLLFWILVCVVFVGTRLLEVSESWWLKLWSQSYTSFNSTSGGIFTMASVGNSTVFASSLYRQTMESPFAFNKPSSTAPYYSNQLVSLDKRNDDLNFYLAVYAAIATSTILVASCRFALIYYGSLKASKKMYETLLRRILRSPLRFFDTTPVGRILNRFSKDFETVDSKLPDNVAWFLNQSIDTASIIIIVCAVAPFLIVPMMLLGTLYLLVGRMFSSTSRQLKRMDSWRGDDPFFRCNEEVLVRNARQVDRWLSLRFFIFGACVSFGTGGFILSHMDTISVSLAGFVLYFALNFTSAIFWTVQRYTSLELALNSVERVVEFSEGAEEAPEIIEPRPPASWPVEGKIDVRDLRIRYAADLDPVLHNLSFTINPQEKIGVVGRTGSGKSTLALSFFRFIEATAGSIVIDGIDIANIGLEDLRSRLTIIPQDPTLFSGTLRSNLDPFDQYEDGEIFESLRRVHLLPSASDSNAAESEAINANVFRNLETPVNEGGKNFSQGQRQLLCLARALLKRTKIVLMDEATASVDFATDEAIQKTIQTEFVDCTILCIAHRLLTVIDYDRILVLDHGKIVEFD
ncbi:P-loop containing nucleoside triphosphate hydrolase protein, partial [Jimgerdemannia flammicorona]